MKSKIIKLKHTALTMLALVLLQTLPVDIKAQNKPSPLNPKLQGLSRGESTHDWIDFREGASVNPLTIFTDLKDGFELKADDHMKINKIEKDNLSFTHYRYQQYYKNLKVIYGQYALHQGADKFVRSANGRMINGLNLGNVPSVTERNALAIAIQFMSANKYLWQNTGMENELKRQEKMIRLLTIQKVS